MRLVDGDTKILKRSRVIGRGKQRCQSQKGESC
uniref:Germin-like protein subfamily 1 member 7 n=1 Tax=Rhizophora mucronata TaxID=61149 RepID=A0A2P2K2L2_RHIMU